MSLIKIEPWSSCALFLSPLTKIPELLAQTSGVHEGFQAPHPDRSFNWSEPEWISQEWADELILRAHCVSPVWSEFALVSRRPSVWEIAGFFDCDDQLFPIVGDDSVIMASSSKVEYLVTVSSVAIGDAVRYQIGLHLLGVNDAAFAAAMAFRTLAVSYGLISYPDSQLIDALEVGSTGDRQNKYLLHDKRQRLVFLFPRSSNLPRKKKDLQYAAKAILAAFGVVIINDTLFKEHKRKLQSRPFDILAVAPGGEAWPIQYDERGLPFALGNILEACRPLPELDPIVVDPTFSRVCWLPSGIKQMAFGDLQTLGLNMRRRWAEALECLGEPRTLSDQPVPSVDGASSPFSNAEKIRKLVLDEEGYPATSEDIVPWIDLKLCEDIVVLPRARRELSKIHHPHPKRIAKALELLAGPKLEGHRGLANANEKFECGLISLRMRDGFSNAQYLNGQTGDSYLVQYDGRRLFLARHLCSNSSGFNDPKMIRIYYVYDKATSKIVVGWLPTHLPTTQS